MSWYTKVGSDKVPIPPSSKRASSPSSSMLNKPKNSIFDYSSPVKAQLNSHRMTMSGPTPAVNHAIAAAVESFSDGRQQNRVDFSSDLYAKNGVGRRSPSPVGGRKNSLLSTYPHRDVPTYNPQAPKFNVYAAKQTFSGFSEHDISAANVRAMAMRESGGAQRGYRSSFPSCNSGTTSMLLLPGNGFAMKELPGGGRPNWKEFKTASNESYYWNLQTNETQWVTPEEPYIPFEPNPNEITKVIDSIGRQEMKGLFDDHFKVAVKQSSVEEKTVVEMTVEERQTELVKKTMDEMKERERQNEPKHVRGLGGLANMGNTCFMNSILQCLCSSQDLIKFFKRDYEELNVSTRKTKDRGVLVKCFYELVNFLRTSDTNYERRDNHFRPKDIKEVMGFLAPQFEGFGQHDAQEWMRFFLAALHEGLNKVVVKPRYVEIKDHDDDDDETRGNRWWKNYEERNDSVVVDCFAGQLKSEVTCQHCNHVSKVFDPFLDLSLPIPKNKAARHNKYYQGYTREENDCTLTDCFREFTQEEHLSGNDAVYCSNCKTHRSVTKQLSIHRIPPLLCIHLKRFSYDRHVRQKLSTKVAYPEVLDMAPFVPKDKSGQRDKNYMKGYKYILYAVSVHQGGAGAGHYIAYANVCREPNEKWVLFNDALSSPSSVTAAINAQAYVLFYRRV